MDGEKLQTKKADFSILKYILNSMISRNKQNLYFCILFVGIWDHAYCDPEWIAAYLASSTISCKSVLSLSSQSVHKLNSIILVRNI